MAVAKLNVMLIITPITYNFTNSILKIRRSQEKLYATPMYAIIPTVPGFDF